MVSRSTYHTPSPVLEDGHFFDWIDEAAAQRAPLPTTRSKLDIAHDDEELCSWSPELELGIPVLDSQRERFLLTAIEIRLAAAAHDHTLIGNLIEQIGAQAQQLFTTEERLMEIAYFPYLEPHRRTHRLFIERLLAFQERHQGGADIGRELLRDVKLFLTSHMRHEDREFVPNVLSIAKQSWLARLCDAIFPPTPQMR